jgi:L-amino acid N-acyltransferase YncA
MRDGAASQLVVRPADPDRDAAACAAIYAPYVTGTAITFELEEPDAAEFARRIARYAASHAWLVAERDGELLGYAYASPHRERAAYATSCDVGVYCAMAACGQGLGRALYGELLPLLAPRYHAAFAGIALPNPASVRLHEAFGFTPLGIYREVGRKLGAWHDVGWWQRLL